MRVEKAGDTEVRSASEKTISRHQATDVVSPCVGGDMGGWSLEHCMSQRRRKWLVERKDGLI
jgi:hypothetical protein